MDMQAEIAQLDMNQTLPPQRYKVLKAYIEAQFAAEQANLDIADTVALFARRHGQPLSVAPEPTPDTVARGTAWEAARRARPTVTLPGLPTVTPRTDATDKTDNPAKRYGVTTSYEVSVSRLSSGLSNHEVPVLVPAGKGYGGQSGTVWGVINEMTFAPSYKSFAFSVLNRAACRKGRRMPDMGTLEDVMSESRLLAYEALFGTKADGLLFQEGIYPVYADLADLTDSTVSDARQAGRAARLAARQAGRQAARPTRAARRALMAGRLAARAAWQAGQAGSVAALKPRAARAARKGRQAARAARQARETWESKRTFATYTLNGVIGWYVNRIARCMTCETCITYEDKPRSKYLIGECETPMDIWEYVTVSRQIMRSLHKAAERALTGEKWKAQEEVARKAANAEIADMAVMSDSPVGDLVEMIAQVCDILGKPVTASNGISQDAANVLAVAFGLETTATGRRVAIARLKAMASA